MRKLLLFAVAAFAMIGCTDHNESDAPKRCTVNLPQTVSASIESVETRVEMNKANQILWKVSDCITLFPGADCNTEYRLMSGSKSTNGEFERRTDETTASGFQLDGYYAVYPHSSETKISPAGKISVTIPTTQKYVADAINADVNVMVAHSSAGEGSSLQFKNVCGYLKVLLYGSNAMVKSCSITGNNGEKIAGVASIGFTKSDDPIVVFGEESVATVTIDCNKGVAIGTSAETATAFIFAIPETTFSDGYTISVTDMNNVTFSKSITGSQTILRNTVQSTEAIKTRLSGEGLEFVDGKVRFYLSEAANGIRATLGITNRNWSSSSVIVNGKSYSISFDEDEMPYIDVESNTSNSYSATLATSQSSNYYGDTPYVGLKFSHSQFFHKATTVLSHYPMYANYTVDTGNMLVFRDCYSLIRLRLKGTAKISSVKVENISGGVLAGASTVNRNNGALTLSRGMDFAVLNCTNNGDFVTLNKSVATDFYIMVAPKSCSKGLKISICDNVRQAMFHTITDITELQADKVYSFEGTYAPDSDLVFYEGFDNCVWGGDIVKGASGRGYSPDNTTIGISSCTDRTGYEDALTEVPYDNPGTCFMQSNTWNDVRNKTIDISHQVSSSFINSRNFSGTQYMFRVQEHPGYIAIGTASTARGIYSSPMTLGMPTIGKAKVTLRFAMQAGFNGTLQTSIDYGGVITEATLDGKKITLNANNLSYDTMSSILLISPAELNIASSASEIKSWHTLELIVNNISDGSRMYVTDTNSNNGVHGIYLDSIEVRRVEGWEKGTNTLRVLMWNIQNGMWADQHNGYDNFVKWVKKYDPDVCIWCESETIYYDKTNSGRPAADRYLPDGWIFLCQRYGHTYAETGGNRDNFSQTVTSKYPITVLNKITGPSSKPVAHGAGHFTITVNGKKINIVTLHMWPQAYGYGVSSANQESSAAKLEGDYYREYEMDYIVNETVNHSNYKNEQLWLFGGDTNSRSRKDQWFYELPDKTPPGPTKYLPHNVILDKTNLKDVIADYYPSNYFMSSTGGGSRIDILYASPAMFDRIKESATVIDSWSNTCSAHEFCANWTTQKFCDPSDHRPVMIDLDMN